MNNIKKTKIYLRIFIAIMISFVVMGFLTTNIFLANSPKIRPNLGNYLLAKLKNFTNGLSSYLASLTKQKTQPPANPVQEVPFQQVAQGVYAKQQNNIVYKEYRVNEINWKEITLEIKGKKYTIRYAEGDPVPDVNLVKELLSK